MASVHVRHYFSIHHIQAATFRAQCSGRIERLAGLPFSDERIHQHRSHVVGSVFACAAFLEAFINELFADAGEREGGFLKPVSLDVRRLMSKMWQQGIPRTARYPILDKYAVALTLADKPQADTGSSPYQDVRCLIDLRNSLIHFEPEWTAAGPKDSEDQWSAHRHEKALRGKFALNPLLPSVNPFYPDQCLSYGCAVWAVHASILFADEFCARFGIVGGYQNWRHRLNPRDLNFGGLPLASA